jgi:hypothetical protein
MVSPQDYFNVICRTITTPDPNDFWGMSKKKTPLVKVGIFRDDGESILRSINPDRFI